VILCGWCGHQTPRDRCTYCGRDPVLPWAQRGEDPEEIPETLGRPALDGDEIRRLYGEAATELRHLGRPVTVEALADRLDKSPRTVRDWRKRFDLH